MARPPLRLEGTDVRLCRCGGICDMQRVVKPVEWWRWSTDVELHDRPCYPRAWQNVACWTVTVPTVVRRWTCRACGRRYDHAVAQIT